MRARKHRFCADSDGAADVRIAAAWRALPAGARADAVAGIPLRTLRAALDQRRKAHSCRCQMCMCGYGAMKHAVLLEARALLDPVAAVSGCDDSGCVVFAGGLEVSGGRASPVRAFVSDDEFLAAALRRFRDSETRLRGSRCAACLARFRVEALVLLDCVARVELLSPAGAAVSCPDCMTEAKLEAGRARAQIAAGTLGELLARTPSDLTVVPWVIFSY